MKRSLYFGTNGSPGHSFIPLVGEFSNVEVRKITLLVDSFNLEKLFIGGYKYRWFKLELSLDKGTHRFFGYAVPYSPDDPRGGSKTVILVENGSEEDIRDLFSSNKFVANQFNKVWDKYKYKNEERI